MSNKSTTTDAHRIGRRGERVAGTRGERTLASVAWPNACAAAALASVLFVGSSGEAVAQTEGQVFTGCVLDADTTVANLKADMGSGFVADGQVAFVVVYTMKDNDGQELAAAPAGRFTGPVICVNPNADGVESEFQGVGIAPINQTDTIPHPATGATAVNTLDAEEVFILRYALADGSNAEVEEKVLCHAVNNVINCFRISPLLR
jgi:hypothetical protein